MKAAHLLGLTFLAAVIGAGIDRLFVTLSSRSTHPSAGFEMQDVKWDRAEGHGYVAHSGSARVVGKGEAATGRYLVLVEFIRSQRVNPADRPDTQWATVMTSQGSG